MTIETDALRSQVASTKVAIAAAVVLIQALNKPVIDPAEIAAATADLKTATDSLTSVVAVQAPAAPASPSTPAP